MASTTQQLKNREHAIQRRLGVFDETAITFSKTRASQAAASLAYYTFFSIFPLMLLLILIGSFFLDRQNMLQLVMQSIQGVLPVPQQFIAQNLQGNRKGHAGTEIECHQFGFDVLVHDHSRAGGCGELPNGL